MSPPRTVLVAVTSAHPAMYPGGKESGLFITEALHPYNVLVKAGFTTIDFVSEDGKWYPDWNSEQADFLSGDDKKVYEDENSPFRQALGSLKKASDVDASKYGVFFASGGHATLIDYPEAAGLHKLAADIYAAGGIVSAVCHGPAILPGIKGSDGKPIIAGKKVTGFTRKGEEDLGVMEEIESWKRSTIEDMAQEVGATYVSPAGPWDVFTVTDGRLVTGANPQSAHKTGEAIVEAFEKL